MSVEDTRERVTTQGAHASKTMVDFAEDLGRLLGTAQAKASNWLSQRKDVIEELTQLRDTANRLLDDLAGGVSAGRRAVTRRSRRTPAAETMAAAGTRSPRRARRTMSAAQRKAVSQRMRKYWAARRKAKGTQA